MPAMIWNHDVLHGLDDIIDGAGTLRERVRDVLIHTVNSGGWSETKSFVAGERAWNVFYHKHLAEKSRVFSAETVSAAGNTERVILWYGTKGDLPHDTAEYEEKLKVAIHAFQRQWDNL